MNVKFEELTVLSNALELINRQYLIVNSQLDLLHHSSFDYMQLNAVIDNLIYLKLLERKGNLFRITEDGKQAVKANLPTFQFALNNIVQKTRTLYY